MVIKENQGVRARRPIDRMINEEYIALTVPRSEGEGIINDDGDELATISTPISDNVKLPCFTSEPKKRPNPKKIIDNKKKEKNTFYVVLILALISLTFIGFVFLLRPSEVSGSSFDLVGEVKKLKSKYQHQPSDIWYNFLSSVDDTNSKLIPTIIILTYSDDGRTAQKLARNLVNVSSLALDARETSLLEIYPGDLSPSYLDDHGRFIMKYHSPLEEHAAIIIHDLHQMPGKIAKALHPFCDEVTPLVKKAVIVFTMKIDKGESDKFSLSSVVENRLHDLWENDVSSEVLKALLVRVVGLVFHVSSDI